MSEIQELLSQIIDQWRKENIPIRPGIAPETIGDFELRNAVRLPHDMREFYLTVDGMGGDYDEEAFVRFWPFDEIRSMAEYVPDFRTKEPDTASYFVFFDHSIDASLHAIRLSESETARTPIANISPPYFDLRFDSLTEFLAAYVNTPMSLI